MLIACLTHADAWDKEAFPFRGLTEKGWRETERAAERSGWFTNRPVLILVDYDRGKAWDTTQVLSCEALWDGKWQNLLQR